MKPADPCRAGCPLPRRSGRLFPITNSLTGGCSRDPAGGSWVLPAIVCCRCQGEAAAIGAGQTPPGGAEGRGLVTTPPPAPPLRRATGAPWRRRAAMAGVRPRGHGRGDRDMARAFCHPSQLGTGSIAQSGRGTSVSAACSCRPGAQHA